jgi:hypothetical protein
MADSRQSLYLNTRKETGRGQEFFTAASKEILLMCPCRALEGRRSGKESPWALFMLKTLRNSA